MRAAIINPVMTPIGEEPGRESELPDLGEVGGVDSGMVDGEGAQHVEDDAATPLEVDKPYMISYVCT